MSFSPSTRIAFCSSSFCFTSSSFSSPSPLIRLARSSASFLICSYVATLSVAYWRTGSGSDRSLRDRPRMLIISATFADSDSADVWICSVASL
jgi:hypothetical protein